MFTRVLLLAVHCRPNLYFDSYAVTFYSSNTFSVGHILHFMPEISQLYILK